ncbi:hypothetical protein MJO28_002492 [Puccinia striiformis f. sp. tritici]|uniref:Uncharacterized protein n=1 Tax=Puccinia striiformis f. sp. tritici TaxID=168172 RepID=A0ACC0ERQ9_9BASI|nr:hypothetical protein MJO28_002492 [Puccinia striiformis f. sp. tritici]
MPLIFTDTQSSPPFRLPPVTSKPGMPSSPPFRLPPVTSTFSPPFRPPPVTSEPRMPFLFADTQSTTHIPRQGRIILPKSTKKRVSSVLKPPPSTELPPIGKAICPAIPPNSIVESSTPDKTSPPAYTMFPPTSPGNPNLLGSNPLSNPCLGEKTLLGGDSSSDPCLCEKSQAESPGPFSDLTAPEVLVCSTAAADELIALLDQPPIVDLSHPTLTPQVPQVAPELPIDLIDLTSDLSQSLLDEPIDELIEWPLAQSLS